MKAGTVLVLGGARSGKSRLAEAIVAGSGLEQVYIATAAAGDDEMSTRIAEHRRRRGPGWLTVEEQLALEDTLLREAAPGRAILVDCLTLWLSNLMFAEADVESRTASLASTLPKLPGLVVLVSNEVGLGLVPETPLGRRFRDAQGFLNQAAAAACDRVLFVAAGLPVALKGPPYP